MPPFPDAVAYASIERSFGAPLGQVFSSLSDSAVAAASLGQVYRGTLRASGQEVAIKVGWGAAGAGGQAATPGPQRKHLPARPASALDCGAFCGRGAVVWLAQREPHPSAPCRAGAPAGRAGERDAGPAPHAPGGHPGRSRRQRLLPPRLASTASNLGGEGAACNRNT